MQASSCSFLQPDLPAVLIQKKVVRTAEGDLRSLASSLFEGYQEPSLPDSGAMKTGGIYLSSSFVFVLSFFFFISGPKFSHERN